MKFFLKKSLDISEETKKLSSYIKQCKQIIDQNDYSSPESSLCLPSDVHILSQIDAMVAKKKTAKLKYVITIGIGGSNLGAKAIYDALYGSVDMFTPDRYPKMIFLDTIDPKINTAFLTFFKSHVKSADEFAISIISKSGTNTEPVVNAEVLLGYIKNRFSKWKQRCVITTDANSPMWNEGARLGIDVLNIPKQVGGRYSVFSAVGLFPLAMANIDIRSLLQGAKKMRDICVNESPENYSFTSSVFQYQNWKKGRSIHNNFYFQPEFESLGKWYRQLMGESIGKEKKGITPIVSIGSVDHHSMVQLYWGGSQDKTTEIIYAKKSQDCFVPQEALFPTLSNTKGKNTSEIVSAIRKGTALAYKKQMEPFFEIEFDEINTYEMGGYMQCKMLEIMYLAKLLGVNAFDQPQVELYKIETKKILAK